MRRGNRREAILILSAELFANNSYSDVSLRDIAKGLGIKAPSIYNHFGSKEEILNELLDRYDQRLIEFEENLLQYDPSLSPFEQLQRVLFQFLPDEEPFMRNIIKIIFKEQFWNEKARQIVLKTSLKERMTYYRRFFDILRQNGIPISKHEKYYAEILVRLSIAYSLDFILLDQDEDLREKMVETSGFILKLILEH